MQAQQQSLTPPPHDSGHPPPPPHVPHTGKEHNTNGPLLCIKISLQGVYPAIKACPRLSASHRLPIHHCQIISAEPQQGEGPENSIATASYPTWGGGRDFFAISNSDGKAGNQGQV